VTTTRRQTAGRIASGLPPLLCSLRPGLIFLLAFHALAELNPTRPHIACSQYADLFRRDHMILGVRIDTASPVLATQFRRALNFWSRVIDMEWHEEASNACSLELTDARPGSLDASIAAEADGPESENFEGWIRFNAAVRLTKTELYYYSVHEIGHLLGLEHNPSHWSVMYFEDTSGPERLDAMDLEALGKTHTLRRPRIRPIYLQTSLWTSVGQVCFSPGRQVHPARSGSHFSWPTGTREQRLSSGWQ
jgi:hypothetical protein